eukprot:scaffold4562_cov132-Skeletonema_menzelii.AAC.4
MNFSSKSLAAIIALAANSHHIIVSAANVSSRRRTSTSTTAESSSPTSAGSNKNSTRYRLFQQSGLLHDEAAEDNYSSKSSNDYSSPEQQEGECGNFETKSATDLVQNVLASPNSNIEFQNIHASSHACFQMFTNGHAMGTRTYSDSTATAGSASSSSSSSADDSDEPTTLSADNSSSRSLLSSSAEEQVYLFPDSGIILSTGSPSNFCNNDSNESTTDWKVGGDADLTALVQETNVYAQTYDACSIEFEFKCGGGVSSEDLELSFDYVFGSDEYYEYDDDDTSTSNDGTTYSSNDGTTSSSNNGRMLASDGTTSSSNNDVFAFYMNGENIAKLPDGETIVSIDTVNYNTNEEYFIANDHTNYYKYAGKYAEKYDKYGDKYADKYGDKLDEYGSQYQNVEADGFTVQLTARAKPVEGWNTVKLAIADVGDRAFDSWVMLAAGSLSCSSSTSSDDTGSPTATVTTSLSPTMVETTSIAPSTMDVTSSSSPTAAIVAVSSSVTAAPTDEPEIEDGVTWPAGGPCMNEVFQSHGNNNNLQCTAKEVNTIATHVEGPLECIQGSTINVNLTISIDFHATRYDFHIYTYTGTQNGDPIFGESCALDHLTEENHLLNQDPENGVFEMDGDSCYDVVAQSGWSLNDYSFQDNLEVPCEFGDDDNVQTVHVQSCYGWRTAGQNSAANKNLNCDLTAAYPGSPSKCSCGYIDIGIPIILQPSNAPSSAPSVSLSPTLTPTTLPSDVPTLTPTIQPSTTTDEPTKEPSEGPSSFPSSMPSSEPSNGPTDSPQASPSDLPSVVPSSTPSLEP